MIKTDGHNIFAVLIPVLFFGMGAFAQTEGPKDPSSNNEMDHPDVGVKDWQNPSAAAYSDNNRDHVNLNPGESSTYAEFTDFDLDVPGGSVIDGIEVTVEKQKSGGNIKDKKVKLVINGSVSGNSRDKTDAWDATEDDTVTYGGSSDTWGNRITAQDLEQSGFGVVFSAENKAGGGPTRTAYVDNISITVHYHSSALPIELLSFDAHLEGKNVKLTWATASETNNDFFTVERSKNGLSFEKIGKVDGAGNSTSKITYEYTDKNPLEGTAYYRLKQTDHNGQFEYFEVVAVEYEIDEKGNCKLTVHPNPCLRQCRLAFKECDKKPQGPFRVEVYDVAGNRVTTKVKRGKMRKGGSFHLNPSNALGPGIYVIKAKGKEGSYSTKMKKQ